MKLLLLAGLASAVVCASQAGVVPTSYDMPNGDGQASGGTFNYWDGTYSGFGSTTTDGAPLSGGLGALTDGVIANDLWFNVENVSGTGPYVGWYAPATPNPTIVFHFAGTVSITSVNIFVDDSGGFGGVETPSGASVSGGGPTQNFSLIAPTGPPFPPVSYSIPVSFTGDTLSLTLDQRNNDWIMLSEVTFDGTAAVPDTTSTFFLLGLVAGALCLSLPLRRTFRMQSVSAIRQ